MENYILKLNSGTEYKLYKGTTLVSDADLTTLFGTAGEMYLSFDFNSGTPSDLTTLTITNSLDAAVISNSNLTDAIAEDKNYKATWSASATTFDTFEELEGKALDESQLSFLMGEIKEEKGKIKTLYLESRYTNPSSLEDGVYNVMLPSDTPANTTRYIGTGGYLTPSVSVRKDVTGQDHGMMIKSGKAALFIGNWYGYANFRNGASESSISDFYPQLLYIDSLGAQNRGISLDVIGIPSTNSAVVQNKALSAAQGKVLADRIGTLSSLTTTDKTSTVAAINELDTQVGNIETILQTLNSGTGAN